MPAPVVSGWAPAPSWRQRWQPSSPTLFSSSGHRRWPTLAAPVQLLTLSTSSLPYLFPPASFAEWRIVHDLLVSVFHRARSRAVVRRAGSDAAAGIQTWLPINRRRRRFGRLSVGSRPGGSLTGASRLRDFVLLLQLGK